jgi:ferredoxin
VSEILRHRSEQAGAGTFRRYLDDVFEIDFGTGQKAPVVTLKSGANGAGLCLGCFDIPCAKKERRESQLPLGFEDFPGDPSQDVCPTQALRWNDAAKAIEISVDCIGCGLCVVRCPYGAITFDGSLAKVMAPEPSALTATEMKSNFTAHPRPRRRGCLARSNAPALRSIAQVVRDLADTRTLLLVRNVLHELGIQCGVRRKGDTNIRMDAIVAFKDGKSGVVEVEVAGAVLDSPRALLEDIAILHGRYAIPTASIVPVSIVSALPSARSEYYQVIEDIRRVLNIRTHTLTIAVLLILLWNCASLETLEDNAFITQEGGADLTECLIKALGADAVYLDGEPYPGALATAK